MEKRAEKGSLSPSHGPCTRLLVLFTPTRLQPPTFIQTTPPLTNASRPTTSNRNPFIISSICDPRPRNLETPRNEPHPTRQNDIPHPKPLRPAIKHSTKQHQAAPTCAFPSFSSLPFHLFPSTLSPPPLLVQFPNPSPASQKKKNANGGDRAIYTPSSPPSPRTSLIWRIWYG